MQRIISDNIAALQNLCRQYNVKMLYTFGSVNTNDFDANSDIDFLIVFKKNISIEEYTDNYFSIQYQLRALFNRGIDLVTENSLSNPYFIKEIEQTKELVYAA